MFEFFSTVFGFFKVIFSIVVNIFRTSSTLLFSLSLGTQFVTNVLLFMPAVIGASMLTVVSVAVVKLILGR